MSLTLERSSDDVSFNHLSHSVGTHELEIEATFEDSTDEKPASDVCQQTLQQKILLVRDVQHVTSAHFHVQNVPVTEEHTNPSELGLFVCNGPLPSPTILFQNSQICLKHVVFGHVLFGQQGS